MEFNIKSFNELTVNELYEILKSRSQVFMLEQDIHCLDMDDVDKESVHCFFTENGRVSAYLRAYSVGGGRVKIGRVLTLERRRGIGTALMERSLSALRERLGCKRICVDAQKQAVGFYEKMGFKAVSGEFMEEGIPHIAMEREI